MRFFCNGIDYIEHIGDIAERMGYLDTGLVQVLVLNVLVITQGGGTFGSGIDHGIVVFNIVGLILLVITQGGGCAA